MKVKKKIAISGMAPREIVKKYGVHRATAYRGLKRGYIWVQEDLEPNPAVVLKALQHWEGVLQYMKLRGVPYPEDARQDTYVKVILSSGRITQPEGIGPWVYTIARYVALSYLKDDQLKREFSRDVQELLESM